MAPQEAIQRVVEAAHEEDVMREQLEYLMDRVGHDAFCVCPECRRYHQVRGLLLEAFADPPRPPAPACGLGPQLVKAA